jgi:hypothetical protein
MSENSKDASSGKPADSDTGDLSGGSWSFDDALRRRVQDGDIAQGARCLYRPGQLLLSDRAAELLQEELRTLDARRDDRRPWLERLGLQVLLVSTELDLVVEASRLGARALELQERADGLDLGSGDAPIIVSLNHVVTGVPHDHGGPAGPPRVTKAWRSLAGHAVGSDPDIAILDTGVPRDKLLDAWHHELDESVRRDIDNARYPDDEDTLYASGTTLRAQAGHGTFIAGLVHLVAPDLVICPYAVLDPDGFADDTEVAFALWLVLMGRLAVPVVNLSLGCYTFDDNPAPAVAAVLDVAPRTSVVVAAAGNDGTDRPLWPAAHKRVVAVGAIDDSGGFAQPTSWSNWGPWVDVCTLGEGLVSTFVEGEYATSTTTSEVFSGEHPFARWSGTSFAAPLVAAEIARRVREDADTGILPTGPLTADAAWRELAAEIDRLGSTRALGLAYWPPVDPRTPRLP